MEIHERPTPKDPGGKSDSVFRCAGAGAAVVATPPGGSGPALAPAVDTAPATARHRRWTTFSHGRRCRLRHACVCEHPRGSFLRNSGAASTSVAPTSVRARRGDEQALGECPLVGAGKNGRWHGTTGVRRRRIAPPPSPPPPRRLLGAGSCARPTRSRTASSASTWCVDSRSWGQGVRAWEVYPPTPSPPYPSYCSVVSNGLDGPAPSEPGTSASSSGVSCETWAAAAA